MIDHETAILLRLEKFDLHPWLQKAIEERANVTAQFDSLPLEEMIVLDNLSEGDYPGLRWFLRKQRGRYLLSLLYPRHLDKRRVKGEG